MSFANLVTDELVSGDPAGVHTEAVTFKGLPERIQTADGPVIVRDAGYLTFFRTFDGDELLSSTISVDRGPHPDAESDFALFCQVMTAALGIS